MRNWKSITIPMIIATTLIYAGWQAPVIGGALKSRAKPALKLARQQLTRARNILGNEGSYSCCISPGCDFCPLAEEGCPCLDLLMEGKGVCPECYGGWHGGAGSISGISKKKVKMASDDELKKTYKKRDKRYKE